MKVKFLKSGRQAFIDFQMGQFIFTEGETKDGIPEADALMMKESGTCEILGDDTVEVEVEDDDNGDNDESKSNTDNKDDEIGASSNQKPWDK